MIRRGEGRRLEGGLTSRCSHTLTRFEKASRPLSVPLEAINKELSRHESNSQQAIIMELSCEESCCSAGNNQAAEQHDSSQLSSMIIAC